MRKQDIKSAITAKSLVRCGIVAHIYVCMRLFIGISAYGTCSVMPQRGVLRDRPGVWFAFRIEAATTRALRPVMGRIGVVFGI